MRRLPTAFDPSWQQKESVRMHGSDRAFRPLPRRSATIRRPPAQARPERTLRRRGTTVTTVRGSRSCQAAAGLGAATGRVESSLAADHRLVELRGTSLGRTAPGCSDPPPHQAGPGRTGPVARAATYQTAQARPRTASRYQLPAASDGRAARRASPIDGPHRRGAGQKAVAVAVSLRRRPAGPPSSAGAIPAGAIPAGDQPGRFPPGDSRWGDSRRSDSRRGDSRR
jgi:hypothetical protein